MKITSRNAIIWGIVVVIVLALIIRAQRSTEGLRAPKPKRNPKDGKGKRPGPPPKKKPVTKKPVTKKPTTKGKRSPVKGNLPPGVDKAYTRPDGNLVVVKDNDKKVIYPNATIPKWLRDQQKDKRDRKDRDRKDRDRKDRDRKDRDRKDRNRKDREDREREREREKQAYNVRAAINKLEKQLDRIEKVLEDINDDNEERAMMERVRDMIDDRLRDLRSGGGVPSVDAVGSGIIGGSTGSSGTGYTDQGDSWVLA